MIIKRPAAILLAMLLAFLLLAGMLSGCDRTGPNERNSIICTIFPQYDWVRQILGEKSDGFELTLLLDNRIDLHSYQPSVSDIAKISSCDLFIYVGGESDGWVEEALKNATNKDMVVINLMETLGENVKTEEIVEGMQPEHDDDDDHDDNYDHDDDDDYDDHGDHGDHDYDEHVWLSLKNAQILCEAIADALFTLDTKNANEYRNNLTAYLSELSNLDADYKTVVDAASYKTLLFADRFPFRYLVDDYGISYYAAFTGCSAETEASFTTFVFLAQKMDELQLPCVLVTESSDQSIARTVIENTTTRNYKICVLDAIQSVSSSDVQNGASYLSIMESNLETLKEALD